MTSQQQDRQQGAGQQQAQDQGHGEFTVQIAYKTPHLGLWNGQNVAIAALGNQQGHSPANLIQGRTGNQRIVSVEEVRDLTVFPLSNDELFELQNQSALKGQSGQDSRYLGR